MQYHTMDLQRLGSLLLKLEASNIPREVNDRVKQLDYLKSIHCRIDRLTFLRRITCPCLTWLNIVLWSCMELTLIKISEIVRCDLRCPSSTEQPYMLQPNDQDNSNIATLQFRVVSEINAMSIVRVCD